MSAMGEVAIAGFLPSPQTSPLRRQLPLVLTEGSLIPFYNKGLTQVPDLCLASSLFGGLREEATSFLWEARTGLGIFLSREGSLCFC